MGSITTFEPAHPERLVGSIASLTSAELRDSLSAARESQPAWSADAPARAEALHKWSIALEEGGEELAVLASREVGKPIREAALEVARGARILRYYSQLVYDESGWLFPTASGRRLEVERRPIGTVMAITPWNFPVLIPLWKLAPALAYGNAVLFKPASAASATAAKLMDIAACCLPDGILNFVPTSSDLVDDLLQDHQIGAVSFTGSTSVGQRITAKVAARGGAVQAEMGGQNATIVLSDADLRTAAATIAEASMAYAGQKCTATSRVVVERGVVQRFVPMLVDHVNALRIDEPEHEHTVVGPLISEAARREVDTAVEEAVGRGAKVLAGGRAIDRDGWYYAPTLLSVESPLDPFAQDETFGPAASVIVVNSADEAIEAANATRFGLAAAVFSESPDRALSIARELDAGLIRVNASTTGVDFHVPFGGYAASSYGPREQGRASREFFTTTRTILVK